MELSLQIVAVLSAVAFGVSGLLIYKLILEYKEIEEKVIHQILIFIGCLGLYFLSLLLLFTIALLPYLLLFVLVLIYTFFHVFKKLA